MSGFCFVAPHAASVETGGKEGRGEAGIGGGEGRTGQHCLLRPALPQPQLLMGVVKPVKPVRVPDRA